ncbi:MAG: DNA repair protein RecN [bacterium]|nr:DNA repair protein RecN [bacterium]
MLLKLSISNFAIIKHMVFEPTKGLNIITGETGSGKSIVMDALSLILGNRADIKTKGEDNNKCIVEGVFKLSRAKYQSLFESLELDFEEETIIRREINDHGKSRSFVNDTPVNLQQIRAITQNLINIHSQHENTQLTDREFQFNLLDNYAGISSEVNGFKIDFIAFKNRTAYLRTCEQKQQAWLKEKDYLNYLLNEFEQINLQINEEQDLESELNLLSNAEAISQVSDAMVQLITDNDLSIVDSLSQLKTQLKAIVNVSSLSKELYDRIESSIIELKDIAGEADNLKQSAMPDGARLEEVNNRLQTIQNLKRKHGILEFENLLKEQSIISDKLLTIGNIDYEIETIKVELAARESELENRANKIHGSRIKAANKIEGEVKSILKNLEMPKAEIKFELSNKAQFDEFGKTELVVMFSANVGMPLQPLNKVASGGELSRLALSFRSIEAGNTDLSTLIFDEIDTGVSGKVADTIGTLFEQLSQKHQIIAITHLPQVAGYGQSHFMIGKREEQNKTVSYLKYLNKNDRVDELAKMLSGNVATDIARKNALELLKTGSLD